MIISILLVSAACAAALAFGAVRWRIDAQALRAQLTRAGRPLSCQTIDFAELNGLPPPVQRYFRTVLKEGRTMVVGAQVRHEGHFNLGRSRWLPFRSRQQLVTHRPGFDWDARIRMLPGLTVYVHDAYVAGEGVLHASLLGLLTVARMEGNRDIAAGELMRFLAEAAWYPTALLPSQGVRWQAVDDRSALATFSDGTLAVTLRFGFDGEGLIETIEADARGRAEGKTIVAMPWLGRFWNYQWRDGMRVPLNGEAAWRLPTGVHPYWRGRICAIDYQFAQPVPKSDTIALQT
ncbi:DUF6920 family protein [Paludibacterium yongneupense]|uniref:DUF6920 family protein n=1 Tax=Paludibacterium yongneupense TaxID=400061 RepID=UPI0004269A8C|nr:DUF6544 family protein [Paludibacterium yongneupense]